MSVASINGLPAAVEIVEVGPRDGLQDEAMIVATADKLAFIDAAAAAGVRRIEVASFANPKRVPQMADAEAVIGALADRVDLRPIALVMNVRGVERAIASGVPEINGIVVVTDTFSQHNQGMTTDEAVSAWATVARRAAAAGVRRGVTLSAAFGCAYEGRVEPARVVQIAVQAADAGAEEIALADTGGYGVPTQVEDLVGEVRNVTGLPVRCHLHNTRNTGLANVVAALRGGATALDASLGGIGGCPFSPGASGNIATEDLAYMLDAMGVVTGLDIDALVAGVGLVERIVGHSAPGAMARAGRLPAVATRARE